MMATKILGLLCILTSTTSCSPMPEAGEGTTGDGSSTTEDASEASTQVEGVCGDGNVDVGEGCDDGNVEDGEGCPSGANGGCVAEGECGDGIVWAGKESCDDGNGVAGDGCETGSCGPGWRGATTGMWRKRTGARAGRAGRAGNVRRMLYCSQVG